VIFRWWKARAEAIEVAETLERENERLRDENAALRNLCRALRDVNADLDQKLLEVANELSA